MADGDPLDKKSQKYWLTVTGCTGGSKRDMATQMAGYVVKCRKSSAKDVAFVLKGALDKIYAETAVTT
jgi:hypothetical protein